MRISVNLDAELYEALMDYAEEEDLTLPQAVEEILSDCLFEDEPGEEETLPVGKRGR